MSHFMSSMPADGLMEMPPVSKVTPLPMNASGAGASPFAGLGALALPPLLLGLGRPAGAPPLHDHELGLPLRALADAEERAHAELLHLPLAQHLDLDAEAREARSASAASEAG